MEALSSPETQILDPAHRNNSNKATGASHRIASRRISGLPPSPEAIGSHRASARWIATRFDLTRVLHLLSLLSATSYDNVGIYAVIARELFNAVLELFPSPFMPLLTDVLTDTVTDNFTDISS